MSEQITRWHRIEMRIPFRDVDSWGLVWHGHYFSYVDSARLSLLRAFHVPFDDFAKLGFLMPVVSVQMDLRAPGRADEPIAIDAAILRVRGAMIDTHFRIVHDTKTLASGSTRQVFTRVDGTLLYHIPEVVKDGFIKLTQHATGQ